MFIISKIIPVFLLPPGLFIALLVVIIVLIKKNKARAAIVVSTALIAIVFLLSIQPVGAALIRYLEDMYPPIETGKAHDADYIVVLGGGIINNSPEEGGLGSLTSHALKRLVYGYRLARIYNIPIIVSGGRVLRGDEAEPESQVAMRELARLGIEKKRIIQEDLSRNTYEEAVIIKRKFSPGKIILVTSASHMPRSVYCFRKNSMEVIPAPADYRGGRSGYTFLSFLPGIDHLETSLVALREYLGFLYYSLRY